MEILMEFGSISWFDSSVNFSKKSSKEIQHIYNHHIVSENSSVLYYTKPGTKCISEATHANMFSFLPSDIEKLSRKNGANMKPAGSVLMLNTEEVKYGIMKWALACVLTKDQGTKIAY